MSVLEQIILAPTYLLFWLSPLTGMLLLAGPFALMLGWVLAMILLIPGQSRRQGIKLALINIGLTVVLYALNDWRAFLALFWGSLLALAFFATLFGRPFRRSRS